MRTNDLKYLFAYTIPIATLISITSDGLLTYTTLLYAFIFIPVLESIFKDVESKKEDSKPQLENKASNIFQTLFLNFQS